MGEIKKIFDDKIKFFYTASFLFLGILAFALLGKHDIGTSLKLDRLLKETDDNLRQLENTADYIDYIGRFDSRFTENKGANRLMEILSTIAKEKGITLGMLKPLEAKTENGYRMTRVSADGNASYSGIAQLIKRLENYDKYIFIEQLGIEIDKNRLSVQGAVASRSMMGGQRLARTAVSEAATDARQAKFTLTIALITPVK